MDQTDDAITLGNWLVGHRQRLDCSLAELAARTRIRQGYLEALEKERFDQLPGEAYLLGFLRLYAGELGLPPAEALRRYRQLVPQASEPVPAIPLSRTDSSAPVRSRAHLAVALVAIGLGLALALTLSQYFGAGEKTVAAVVSARPATPETVPSGHPAPAPSSAPAVAVAPMPPAASTAVPPAAAHFSHAWPLPVGGGILRVEALASCRVQVVVDGRPPRDYQLPVGAVLKWPVKKTLILTMVDPGRLRCWLDGKQLAVLEGQGLKLEPSTARN